MKRKVLKTFWILVLIAIMILPPLRAANAAGFNYYTSIWIYKYPDKMTYTVGESFDKTGMRIFGNRTKADGSTDKCEIGIGGLTFKPATFTKAGKNIKVTITLNCMAASGKMEPFSLDLYVNVDEMEGDPPLYWTKKITAEAKKTVYLVGDSFDKSGMKVWAHSEGDYPPEAAKWNCTKYVKNVSPTTFTKAGEQYVTVTAHLTTEHSSADFTAKIKVKVYNKIEITKHPGSEIVEEGDACNFTVKANHADQFTWYFVKGKSSVAAKEAGDFFPGLKVSGASEKKLKLSNIPLSLDGWSVRCDFSNKAQTVSSDTAKITVYEKEAPAATEVPAVISSEAPAETPTAAAVPETTPDKAAEASANPTANNGHTHTFDGVYRHNSTEHWLECSCGERTAVAKHVVAEWKTLSNPTKSSVGIRRGICAVCGAEVLESVPYDGYETEDENNSMSLLLIIGLSLFGVAFLGCILAIILLIARNRRSKKRAHARHSS